MDATQAQRVIESLRKGIPPDGFVRCFTVGRKSEIAELETKLTPNGRGALLLKANYGSGKTHLLRFIKELALEKDFAVSAISLDASAGVRFNRMDQILGSVIRCIEVPDKGLKGPVALFEAVLDAMTSPCSEPERKERLDKLSSMGRWDYSATLKSPALYVALRAWIIASLHGDEHLSLRQDVEAWLCEPWNYYTRTRWLYDRFVYQLRRHFRDPRANWQFYRQGTDTFIFKGSDYRQSWDALSDLDLLAHLSGLNGFVILVDEFEDVLYNLKRINYQQEAFWNLFRLFDGEFPGLSFYAVTPAFVEKCKYLLLSKGFGDYDFARFDRLHTFVMSPLESNELEDLAARILHAHGVAYGWSPDLTMKASHLKSMVQEAASMQIQDRARHTITTIVRALDSLYQDKQ